MSMSSLALAWWLTRPDGTARAAVAVPAPRPTPLDETDEARVVRAAHEAITELLRERGAEVADLRDLPVERRARHATAHPDAVDGHRAVRGIVTGSAIGLCVWAIGFAVGYQLGAVTFW